MRFHLFGHFEALPPPSPYLRVGTAVLGWRIYGLLPLFLPPRSAASKGFEFLAVIIAIIAGPDDQSIERFCPLLVRRTLWRELGTRTYFSAVLIPMVRPLRYTVRKLLLLLLLCEVVLMEDFDLLVEEQERLPPPTKWLCFRFFFLLLLLLRKRLRLRMRSLHA